MQQGINFAEARETLEKLTIYINQKIEKRNSANANELNLASQPEIASDHLGEETPLSPVASTQQVPSTANEMVDLSQTQFSTASDTSTIGSQATGEEALVQGNQSMQETPASMGVNTTTNQPMGQLNETQVQVGESTVNTLIPQLEPSTSSESTPKLETIPDIDLSGVINQEGEKNETSSVSQFDGIPEVTPPKVDEGYKAIMNNATIGYPTETTPEATPVVMPNGMTQDMALDSSVVVGPEAFNMTR